MIDNFSILLSHALIAIAFYLLLQRKDLDEEDPPIPDQDIKGFADKSLRFGKDNMRPNKNQPNNSSNISEKRDDLRA